MKLTGRSQNQGQDQRLKLTLFRLMGTTGIFPRVTAEEATILGYRIPAKVSQQSQLARCNHFFLSIILHLVFYSVHSAGRDEKLFHDPLKFDPERWRKKTKGIPLLFNLLVLVQDHAVVPFADSHYSCTHDDDDILQITGRRFAELELKLLLAQVRKSSTS